MAKQPKNQNPSDQLEITEKLLVLKLGSVQVPYVEEGKGGWKTVNQRDWNLKDQASLFDYWRNLLFDGLDDNKKELAIKAKMDKLFMPDSE
jgi:hypothetical protein